MAPIVASSRSCLNCSSIALQNKLWWSAAPKITAKQWQRSSLAETVRVDDRIVPLCLFICPAKSKSITHYTSTRLATKKSQGIDKNKEDDRVFSLPQPCTSSLIDYSSFYWLSQKGMTEKWEKLLSVPVPERTDWIGLLPASHHPTAGRATDTVVRYRIGQTRFFDASREKKNTIQYNRIE